MQVNNGTRADGSSFTYIETKAFTEKYQGKRQLGQIIEPDFKDIDDTTTTETATNSTLKFGKMTAPTSTDAT